MSINFTVPAEIEESLRNLKNSRTGEIYIYAGLSLLGLVITVAAIFLLKGDSQADTLTAGPVVLVVGLLCGGVALYKGQANSKHNRELVSGRYWLHWTYGSGQLDQYYEQKWQDWRKTFAITLVIIGLTLAFIDAGIVAYLRSNFIEGPFVLIGSILVFGAVGVIAWRTYQKKNKKLHPTRGEKTVHVFIDRNGAFWTNSGYEAFLGPVTEIQVLNLGGVQTLVLSSKVRTANLSNYMVKTTTDFTTNFLIPAEKMSEAENLEWAFNHKTLQF